MKHILTYALFIFLLVPMQAQAGSDPIQTIKDIQTALETADEKLFEASIDMESLVGQCIDVLMDDASKEGQTTVPPVLALILSTANMTEETRSALHGTLVTEVDEFIRYGVRSGAFAGKKVEAAPPGGVLAPFLANASMGRKEIVRIGDAIQESGAVYVTCVIKDHENGRLYPVEAWLRQTNGNYKVIGLRNVRTLTRMLQNESSTL